jgi:hypothetical protein
MTQFYPPSYDDSSDNDLTEAFEKVFEKSLRDLDGMLPAMVVGLQGKNRVAVVPMVRMVTTNGATIERARIASVPVVQIGGGGYMLAVPIKAGDLGWIKACDRDISTFMQSYKSSAPPTARIHSFSDGVFIPHVMTNFIINSEDDDHLVLQKNDGSVRLAVCNDRIKITGLLTIEGSVRATGNIAGNRPIEEITPND